VEAQQAATFPVQSPERLPGGYVLKSIMHFWPDNENIAPVHADRIEAQYEDSTGGVLLIIQGFTGKYAGMYSNAPKKNRGVIGVNGKEAWWVRDWPSTSFALLAWQTGIDEGSPRYVSVVSNKLSLEELVEVASSLR
jgi:hypothetical protein